MIELRKSRLVFAVLTTSIMFSLAGCAVGGSVQESTSATAAPSVESSSQTAIPKKDENKSEGSTHTAKESAPENDTSKNTYTVHFETFGGTKLPSQTIKVGDNPNVGVTTRPGFVFVTWNGGFPTSIPFCDGGDACVGRIKAHMQTIDFNDFVKAGEEITLYAYWARKGKGKCSDGQKQVVHFDSRGGSQVPDQVLKSNYAYDNFHLGANPTRPGYRFVSWEDAYGVPFGYGLENYDTSISFFAEDGKSNGCELTLYAKWAEESDPDYTSGYYTVRFVESDKKPRYQKVQVGKPLHLGANPVVPNAIGDFTGWEDKEGFNVGNGCANCDLQLNIPADEELVLYARWPMP